MRDKRRYGKVPPGQWIELELSDDPTEILEALVISNEQRERTNEQKIREFGVLREIEEERAKQRMAEAGEKSAPGRPTEKGVENFPQVTEQGKSRDLAAYKVGFSGKTAEKGAEVVAAIDLLEAQGDGFHPPGG